MGFVYRQIGFGTSCKSLAEYAMGTGRDVGRTTQDLVTRAGDEDVKLTDMGIRTSVGSK